MEEMAETCADWQPVRPVDPAPFVPAGESERMRRCEAILDFRSLPDERLFRGRLLRGHKLLLTLNREAFISHGDAYLFCSALDMLLSEFSLLNNYTQLHVTLANENENWSWTPRLGTRPLI